VVEDQAAGRVAIAMRLCAGGELFEDVVRKQHYGERQAAAAVRALASYLAAAHAVGVVHRDLKPENILLVAAGSGYDAAGAAAAAAAGLASSTYPRPGPGGTCSCARRGGLRVVDLGCAALVRPGQRLKPRVGTPYYVAPEVLTGRGAGPPSDVWSLGVIAYILLSGRPPFGGADDAAVLRRVRRAAYSFGGPEWGAVSPAAKDAVRRMLDPNPDARLTAADVLALPWLAPGGAGAPAAPLAAATLARLRSFAAASRLHQVAALTLTRSVSEAGAAQLADVLAAAARDCAAAAGAGAGGGASPRSSAGGGGTAFLDRPSSVLMSMGSLFGSTGSGHGTGSGGYTAAAAAAVAAAAAAAAAAAEPGTTTKLGGDAPAPGPASTSPPRTPRGWSAGLGRAPSRFGPASAAARAAAAVSSSSLPPPPPLAGSSPPRGAHPPSLPSTSEHAAPSTPASVFAATHLPPLPLLGSHPITLSEDAPICPADAWCAVCGGVKPGAAAPVPALRKARTENVAALLADSSAGLGALALGVGGASSTADGDGALTYRSAHSRLSEGGNGASAASAAWGAPGTSYADSVLAYLTMMDGDGGCGYGHNSAAPAAASEDGSGGPAVDYWAGGQGGAGLDADDPRLAAALASGGGAETPRGNGGGGGSAACGSSAPRSGGSTPRGPPQCEAAAPSSGDAAAPSSLPPLRPTLSGLPRSGSLLRGGGLGSAPTAGAALAAELAFAALDAGGDGFICAADLAAAAAAAGEALSLSDAAAAIAAADGDGDGKLDLAEFVAAMWTVGGASGNGGGGHGVGGAPAPARHVPVAPAPPSASPPTTSTAAAAAAAASSGSSTDSFSDGAGADTASSDDLGRPTSRGLAGRPLPSAVDLLAGAAEAGRGGGGEVSFAGPSLAGSGKNGGASAVVEPPAGLRALTPPPGPSWGRQPYT